ncbi:MAG: xanthine dehydrogenase family protein molybdopterin-binding subunit [Oscillospiraceae bacterium]|nr:xanthine dehydrogenase family protein molybdopterin-binding subunit [Oscillospiraceae bacterium]MDD4367576.1 xanthine dehydrogenase family protein molybdopterin-binding subunit [Oscillospiraceae bacterium]
MRGEALYVDDLVIEGLLYGRLLHSDRARARIRSIRLPKLPPEVTVVDWRDAPARNQIHIVQDDMPIFAKDEVAYVGDVILMLVGPDEQELQNLLSRIQIDYQELTPVLDPQLSQQVFFDYHYGHGQVEQAFAEADHIFSETFHTGLQEQAYLEPNGLIAIPGNRKMTVRGSMQCPYYVKTALVRALGEAADQVQVVQEVTGGGFGGKEDYPSVLACQLAVAALKTGRPVKCILNRREDMATTTKRHPSRCHYKVAVKAGQVTAMDIDVLMDSGAYTTLSPVVLQRGIIGAPGVYRIPNLRVHGQARKTNTVPNGAFRGFGAPQTFFAVEMMMSHIAAALNQEPLAFKARQLVSQGDETSTGGRYHFYVSLPDLIKRAEELSHYREKRQAYARQTAQRYRRGIGIALIYHGCGFTGNSERDFIKAVVKLKKRTDDRVEVLASNADIGQGIKTTFAKIVADQLALPLEQIIVNNPDTDKVPDSGPTVASRSLMTVGQLLAQAAARLKQVWEPGKEQVIEEHYQHPEYMIPFDMDRFAGDAYPTYSWAVSVVELELDRLTGTADILGAWGIFDVGVPIDYNIVQGQMQGGFLQGLGYACMEHLTYSPAGVPQQTSFTDYIIPTAADVPNLVTDLVNNPFSHGPYGAKGAGEMPMVGVAPAYLEALEQAMNCGRLEHVPFTAEDVLDRLSDADGHLHPDFDTWTWQSKSEAESQPADPRQRKG